MDFLLDGDEAGRTTVLFAHGAGAAMDTVWMSTVAGMLAQRGLRVARFEFSYMAARRTGGARKPPGKAETFMPEYQAAIAALDCDGPLIIGGKSMGGRVASLIAERQREEGRICGLLCLGFPFHAPGKPEQVRSAHLAATRCPTLICQGTRDPFGTRDEVETYALSPAVSLFWAEDGDHDLKPRKRLTGKSLEDHLNAVADRVAAWAEDLA